MTPRVRLVVIWCHGLPWYFKLLNNTQVPIALACELFVETMQLQIDVDQMIAGSSLLALAGLTKN